VTAKIAAYWKWCGTRTGCLLEVVWYSTVKGELRVARFLVNYFKRAAFPDGGGCAPHLIVPGGTAANRKVELALPSPACHLSRPFLLPYSFLIPPESAPYVSAIMGPQLNSA
jgi:hypothetical protein